MWGLRVTREEKVPLFPPHGSDKDDYTTRGSDSDLGWPLTFCPWWQGTPTSGGPSFDRAELGGVSVFMWEHWSKPIARPELALEAVSLLPLMCTGDFSVTLKPPSLVVLEGNMSDVLGLADGSVHECGCGFNAWTSLWARSQFPGSSV